MFKVPCKIGWENIKSYDEQGLPNECEVSWADNDDNLTHNQAILFCDVLSKEEKEVEKIMDDDEFEEYLDLKYPSTTLEVRI